MHVQRSSPRAPKTPICWQCFFREGCHEHPDISLLQEALLRRSGLICSWGNTPFNLSGGIGGAYTGSCLGRVLSCLRLAVASDVGGLVGGQCPFLPLNGVPLPVQGEGPASPTGTSMSTSEGHVPSSGDALGAFGHSACPRGQMNIGELACLLQRGSCRRSPLPSRQASWGP